MTEPTTVDWVADAIKQATRAAKFCVAGDISITDPVIEVDGLGAIQFPLKKGMGKKLVAACHTAPYGKGTRTLVDKSVRNTFELNPEKFRLTDAWASAVEQAVQSVAVQLGLPADGLESHLYKLLVYEKGGFFLPHRDSEKHDRMVASLIVVLPNSFEGGALIVRHGGKEETVEFDEASQGESACFAAFYADCEHEVERVSSGVRVCLTYNLVLTAKRTKQNSMPSSDLPGDTLSDSMTSWISKKPAEPLVFALEHHYTERGLSLDLLKGVDRQLAEMVLAAAEKADCMVYLAQVSRHLLQFADDGSYDHWRSRRYGGSRQKLEIGETYEDDLVGSSWIDAAGKRQPWGEIAFEMSAVVSKQPINEWTPTSEDYEGYTGNEGNTLNRWYHRSAIVVWSRSQHFEVVASSGTLNSVTLFCSMVAKLAKTPKKRLEETRQDCIRFARAIIGQWAREYRSRDAKSPYDDFLKVLPALHDRDTIAHLFSKLAEPDCDPGVGLSTIVVEACHEFGWNAFSEELKRLLASWPIVHGEREIIYRDVEWLCAFCCDRKTDQGKLTLAHELCAIAVERFCESLRERTRYHWPDERPEASDAEKSLPLLLKSLIASHCDKEISRVTQTVMEQPGDFNIDICVVPCLKTVIPWSRKKRDTVPAGLISWLQSVRAKLEAVTEKPPEPPTTWVRPAKIKCGCAHCDKLKAFLADPENEVGRIAAREADRRHLTNVISQYQCDVSHSLERTRSPFSLVLTKTNASYDREVKRFKVNQKLLNSLPDEE